MNLDLLLEFYTLKDIPRAGWIRKDILQPESVAAHSWGVAWLCLSLCPKTLDLNRVLAMALVHDLTEARTGDITPYDNIDTNTKHSLERKAAEDLFSKQPQTADLWTEYIDHQTPESEFVHQIDKLDMAIQALQYFRQTGIDTTEFITSAAQGISLPSIRKILQEITHEMRRL